MARPPTCGRPRRPLLRALLRVHASGRDRVPDLPSGQPGLRDRMRRACPREPSRRPGADLQRDVGAPQPAPSAGRPHPAGARARGAARVPGSGPGGLACLPGRDQADALARRGVRVLSLGAHLERADTTARVLLTNVPTLVDGSGDRLSSLLRSCGAFEAFRRHESEAVQGERVADFLLLDRSFPRSVLFCAERCLEAIRFVSGNSQQPERSLGILVARLAFADVPQLEPPSLAALLDEVLVGLNVVGSELGGAYFATRVVLPGPYAQQQQQQQQGR